jgi:predicted ATPase
MCCNEPFSWESKRVYSTIIIITFATLSGGDKDDDNKDTTTTTSTPWINTAAFSFAHDRLQQAAAQCLTNKEEEAEFHFFLGKQR